MELLLGTMNFLSLSLSWTCFKQSVIIIITNSNHFSQSDPPLYLRGLTELTGSNLLSLSSFFLFYYLLFISQAISTLSPLFSFRHILLDGRLLFFVVVDEDDDQMIR